MWYFRLPPWKRTPEISVVFLLRGRAWRLRFYLIEAPESRPQRHSDQIDHVAQRCRMRFDSPVQRAPVPQRGFSKTFKWLLLLLIKCNLCHISNLIWGHTLVSFQLQITSSAICKIVFVQCPLVTEPKDNLLQGHNQNVNHNVRRRQINCLVKRSFKNPS